MQHLDEGTIHAWLDGELDAEEAARVEQHAAACAECAAAIAEARGLAAGASRILASLDNVPAGVIPGTSAAGGTSFTARRSRSLWNTLRLTPARAAAAALVFVAAGTVLVLQHKSDMPAASPIVFAKFDTTRQGRPAATESPTIANGPRKMALPVAAPRAEPKTKQHADAAMSAVVATSSQVADSMSTSPAPRLTTESANRAVAAPAPSPMAMDAAKSAVVAGAAGVPSAALRAPERAARSKMALAQSPSVTPAICYSVDGDSLPMLPRRIVLDTPRVVEGRAVAAVVGGVVTPVASWHWSPRPGGINLLMTTPSASAVQLDSIATSGDMRGAMSLNGRQLTVLLRRVDCPSPR